MNTAKKTKLGISVFSLVFVLVLVANLVLSGCRLDSGDGPGSGISGTAPDSPTNVNASALGTSITVSWSSVSSAEGYYVYRNTSSNGTYSRVQTTSSTSYKENGLPEGTRYYYKVAAWNSAGVSPDSSSTSTTTIPPAPRNLSAWAESSDSISLSWSSAPGAAGYRVYYSLSGSGVFSYVGAAASPEFLDTGLSPVTVYYYKVSAYNSAGESSESEYAYAMTSSK